MEFPFAVSEAPRVVANRLALALRRTVARANALLDARRLYPVPDPRAAGTFHHGQFGARCRGHGSKTVAGTFRFIASSNAYQTSERVRSEPLRRLVEGHREIQERFNE